MLRFFFILGIALMSTVVAGVRGGEPLKAGETVVFLGDSITQAGAGPGGYVTLFTEQLRQQKPDLDVEVVGAGISGNRVPDLERRLEKDVLAKDPDVVVIYIGINDVWHSQQGRGTPKDEFAAGLKRIVGDLQKAGARVVLCTPSVIGEKFDGSNKLDQMLDEYAAVSREVARETGAQLLDLRKAFLAHLSQANKEQRENGVLTTDGVHLNAAGNQFVATQMLAALTGQHADRLLRHMVLFQFKPEVTPEQVQEVVTAFAALPAKIDSVKDFEWGLENSPEKLADGFTHCFLLTFASEEGRAEYLPHPAHQEFVTLIKPRIARVLVVDYWTER